MNQDGFIFLNDEGSDLIFKLIIINYKYER